MSVPADVATLNRSAATWRHANADSEPGGSEIRRLRREARMSQVTLATLAGLSRETIRVAEDRDQVASRATLALIADVFDVDPSSLR
jgi:DNA-binding XRE family transcriptional regulator